MSTDYGAGEKTPRKALIFALVLFLCASTAFALGFLAGQMEAKTPIIIEDKGVN